MNLVIWILSAVIAAGIASGKGANVWFWFVIGFLFGPLGAVCSLFAKPANKESEL